METISAIREYYEKYNSEIRNKLLNIIRLETKEGIYFEDEYLDNEPVEFINYYGEGIHERDSIASINEGKISSGTWEMWIDELDTIDLFTIVEQIEHYKEWQLTNE